MKRLRELEEENSRLKRIVADLTLDREILQDVIKRNDWKFILEGIQVSQKQVSRWIRAKLLDAEFATWRSRQLQQ